MGAERTKLVRRERSLAEVGRLRAAITLWLDHRRRADCDKLGHYVGRHKTQLESIGTVLTGAAEVLEHELQSLDSSLATGEFMERCRDLDEVVVWLERFWSYFRDKFDQRDNNDLRLVLQSADEVVWSCYQEILGRARTRRPDLSPGASPLAFVAPEYSPAALESDSPLRGALEPPLAGGEWGNDVRNLVQSLPIPLLRLPTWSVASPWWLVYIAHEAGHHLLSDLHLVRHVGEGVEAAAKEAGGSSDSLPKRWRAWSEEVFADAVSIVLMGPWSLWSIVEVEWSTDELMQKPKRDYPPPIVRIALMARMLEQLGVEPRPALRGLELPDAATAPPLLAQHLAAVEPVVRFLLAPLPDGLGTLASLAGFNAASQRQAVDWWVAQLRAGDTRVVPPKLSTAREVTAATVARWADFGNEDQTPDDWAAAASGLAKSAMDLLSQSGPPGTRADVQPSGATAAEGKKLCQMMITKLRERRQEAVAG